ncbi:MAG: division/cell wall cluster transcriptional repressor MraZ [Thermodesulfobacteriota bacterium]
MDSFRGIFPHTLDSKGRVSVPNRFRDVLKDCPDPRLVVTHGSNGCLAVYPMPRWKEAEDDVARLPGGEEKDKYIRHFISPAQDCAMDKMNRMLIPAQMREVAGLNREVLMVGALDKFEIWDKAKYETYMAATRESALELRKIHEVRI